MCNKQLITMRYLYLLQVFKTEIFYPVIKVKVIKVIKVSGEKHFPIVYI